MTGLIRRFRQVNSLVMEVAVSPETSIYTRTPPVCDLFLIRM